MVAHRNGDWREPAHVTGQGWITTPGQRGPDPLSPPARSLGATPALPNANAEQPWPTHLPKARRPCPWRSSSPWPGPGAWPGLPVQPRPRRRRGHREPKGRSRACPRQAERYPASVRTTRDALPHIPLNSRTVPHPTGRHSTSDKRESRDADPDGSATTRDNVRTGTTCRPGASWPDDLRTNRHRSQCSTQQTALQLGLAQTIRPSYSVTPVQNRIVRHRSRFDVRGC